MTKRTPFIAGNWKMNGTRQGAALLARDGFAGIDGARFKRPVEPGDQLILEVTLLRMKAGIFKFKARAMVGDDLAVEAELTCAMRAIA